MLFLTATRRRRQPGLGRDPRLPAHQLLPPLVKGDGGDSQEENERADQAHLHIPGETEPGGRSERFTYRA